jgi:hypothetical protein
MLAAAKSMGPVSRMSMAKQYYRSLEFAIGAIVVPS